jgi:hypothetical protein
VLMGNRSDRRPKSLITLPAPCRGHGTNEDRARGCSIRVSGQNRHAAQKTEYRDAVSTYWPSTHTLAINGEAI